MKHDLAEKWDERLLGLQLQIAREPANLMIWHWRGEARVLRFLLQRYGEIAPPRQAATPDVAASEEAPDAPEVSALQHSLLRLALLIPSVANKHSRPAPRQRAEILERIKIARDEARQIEADEESWWDEINAQARRRALKLSEREEEWRRREVE